MSEFFYKDLKKNLFFCVGGGGWGRGALSK